MWRRPPDTDWPFLTLAPLNDFINVARGFLMGSADIVPGVSGGTVALVLGIYQRLLDSISKVDRTFLSLLFGAQFRRAAGYVDLRFLIALGAGIGLAVVSLASLMHYLLEHHLAPTYAAFFGLILASGVLVGRMCRPASADEGWRCVAVGVAAAAAAYVIVSQGHLAAQPGFGYTFLSGAVAICAMILPGVSGSYLLLMLGKYHEITGIIKGVPKLAVTGAELATLAVFAAGCVVGLLLFSRLLKALLTRFPATTMAALCGFMIGSLKKIWPFQIDTTPTVEEFKEKVFVADWSPEINSEFFSCVVIAVVACAGVLVFDALARRRGEAPTAEPAA